MSPYIKSLDSTDIMSERDKKTPILSGIFFADDPMGQYLRDKEGITLSGPPPLPPDDYDFKEELDFIYDMRLRDLQQNERMEEEVPYEVLQRIATKQSSICEEVKNLSELAMAEGDLVKAEAAYKSFKEIDLVWKQMLEKIRRSEMRNNLERQSPAN